MSSISGVFSSPTWLQLLQTQSASSAAATTSNRSTGSTTTTSAASATSATDSTAGTRPHRHGGKGGVGRFEKALEDQGVTGTKLSDLRTQIDSAFKSAKADGTDPKAAINSVLSDAGIDVAAFDKETAPPSGGLGGAGGPPPGPPPAGPDSTTAVTSSTSSSTTATSSLNALLSGTGLDATSFTASLASLFNGNSSATDTSSLFANASIGSSLDVAA